MIPLMQSGPGEGERWERLAVWLREQLPVEEVDGIWVFRVVRREQREFGTAVLSLVSGDRRRIVTARYVATIKGRERGGFTTQLETVGSGPLEALHELLAMVPIRADDEDPPAAVDPVTWFPPLAEGQGEAGDPVASSVDGG
ncbi:MAG TPA: hypothetical protein PLL69_10010 [Gemmatimonadales bacterium]|nr:hypothetical protein [Gemmatimonadales bacterium]